MFQKYSSNLSKLSLKNEIRNNKKNYKQFVTKKNTNTHTETLWSNDVLLLLNRKVSSKAFSLMTPFNKNPTTLKYTRTK